MMALKSIGDSVMPLTVMKGDAMKRRYRLNYTLSLIILLLALITAGTATAQTAGAVKLAQFKGPVTPVLASYIARAIDDAEASGAVALVINCE